MTDNAIINSEKYWDTRFSKDWESNNGPNQSRFFAKLAIEHLPRWLLEQIRQQSLTLVDWGCAQGDGTDVWAEYFYNNRIVGVDFSSAAIKQAAKKYPEIQFVYEDWLAVKKENLEVFDVLFSSNTLEHFHKPYDKLHILCNRVKKAIILVLPFEDKVSFEEHFFSFMPENIPLQLPNSFRLLWSKVVDCSYLPETFWSGEQIFLVFADPAWVDTFRLNLCDIYIAHNDNESIINALNTLLEERDLNISQLERNIAERSTQLSNSKAALEETKSELYSAKTTLEEISSKHEKTIMESDITIRDLKNEKAKYQDEVAKLRFSLSTISQELNLIKLSTGWRILQYLWKIRVFVFPRGSRRERVGYKLMRYQRTIRLKFTGIKIERQYKFLNDKKRYIEALRQFIFKKKVYKLPLSKKSEDYLKNLKSQYAILCLPIIDWNFRFQRPQQIMRQFSKKGHEIFYVRQLFSDRLTKRSLEAGVTEITLPGPAGTNVYQTVLSHDDARHMSKSIIKFLDDCGHNVFICLVQLPFWEPLASQLRDITGCKVVYDCMDEHAGFSTNSQIMLDAEKSLVCESDLVVASSDLLFQKLKPLAQKSAIVRNAADFNHFSSVPHRPYNKIKGKIIGYYGAIADWFDSELVGKIARLHPDWNFVLIGSTFSADLNDINKCRNIEILGEKPYEDLPKLIETWDCCIIPFKITPLTEATNPVKIYEMLAAGKPVVSVGLPELKSLAEDNLITIADDALSFAKAIEVEISNDSQEKMKIRRYFAANNTWEKRQLFLDAEIRKLYPLVSIIIVTFNNLALNRLCLRSVLNDSDYPNVEVIIVDNASTDGTPDYLKEQKSIDTRIKIILNSDNLGFASANNQGAAIARGEFLCFLNNDTVVSGNWLSTLVRHLQADSTIGMIGPVTNAIGNEAQIKVGYERIEDMPDWSKTYCRKNRGQLIDISMLAFFCVLVPKSIWENVGKLDEQFGKGMFEDDDYNRRVCDSGLKIKLARDSFVHHWQKASFNQLGNAEYLRIYHENQRKYHAKWQEKSIKNHKISEKMTPLFDRTKSTPATIIFAPSVGWAIQLAQRPHHLARALAREGYTVVFDVSNSHDNVDIIEEIEENLFLYNQKPNILYDIDRKIVWTFTYNYNYLDYYPKETKVIYDWIDDITVFPYDQKMLTAFHDRALRKADVIFTVAKKLHMAALKVRPDAIYLPNGVEKDLFDREPEPNPALQDPDLAEIINSGRPIAGYYGALAGWFDYDLLRQVAELRQDWEFVLIGVDYDGSVGRTAIRSSKNIHWIGPRDYYTLPGYLHVFDVALIPFKLNDITVATSPLKLYEYFAGGKPVITTAMPECMLYREVCIVNGPNEFSNALDIAYESASDVSFREQLRGLASKNTWSSRAKEALNAIGSIDKQVGTKRKTQRRLKY
jgi:GT2 family glycosyltransferase/ubiquinone/menaquinone biosynthesis C-methylase UbiE